MTGIFSDPGLSPEQSLSGAKTALLAIQAEGEEGDRRRDAEFLARTGETYRAWQSRCYRHAVAYGPSEGELADEDVDIPGYDWYCNADSEWIYYYDDAMESPAAASPPLHTVDDAIHNCRELA